MAESDKERHTFRTLTKNHNGLWRVREYNSDGKVVTKKSGVGKEIKFELEDNHPL